MSSCTYKFKNASGEEVTITGQAEMKAFLANGGLEQLLPGKVLPWSEKNSLQRDSSWVIKNKETGDRLSIIPEYTLNSTLSWQVHQDVSLQSTFTWYGKQQPKKYNYKGQPAVGPETKEISPYSIVGLSATWDVTKNVSLTGGVDNLFDKRLWRAGNAQTTGDLAGANYIAGAGAYTYNEPGRTWYMSINTHF